MIELKDPWEPETQALKGSSHLAWQLNCHLRLSSGVNAIKRAVTPTGKCHTLHMPHKRMTIEERLSVTKIAWGGGWKRTCVSIHEHVSNQFKISLSFVVVD